MRRLLQRGWWLLLLVPVIIGLSRVQFDTEVLNLLPDDVPEVAGLKLYQRNFTDNRELLITVRSAEAAVTDEAARVIGEHLRARTNLATRVVWQPPWQEHPEQLAELVACLWLNQPPENVADLTNRLAPDRLDEVLADTREELTTSFSPMALGRLGYDPLGLTRLPGQDALGLATGETSDWFTSADGTLRVMYIEAPEPSANYLAVRRWLKDVREEIASCLRDQGWATLVQIRYTGAPAFVAEISTGMESDMRNSVIASLVIIAALFWWAHRSWRPLLWLGVFLGVVVVVTLSAGGLLWGRINAVSTGFAAILLGLAVDYALVLYQESVASPERTTNDIRRLLAPSLVWSAITTACAFGLLIFAGLPGMVQLGSLIAIGILLAAVLMLFGFLPVTARGRQLSLSSSRSSPFGVPALTGPVRTLDGSGDRLKPGLQAAVAGPRSDGSNRKPWGTLMFSGVLATVALAVCLTRGPRVDHSSGSMQPKHCQAQLALDELELEMNHQGKPSLIVVAGSNEEAVAKRLDELQAQLEKTKAAGEISNYTLPTGLWPHPARARTNLAALTSLHSQIPAMQSALDRAGFTTDAVAFTANILNWWQAHATSKATIWPTNTSGQWMLRRAVARTESELLAAGMVTPLAGKPLPEPLQQLHLANNQTWITGWPQLVDALLEHIEARLGWLVVAMIALLTTCLWLAFRRWSEVLLSFATLGFSLLLLLGVMAVAGWSWNLMSLMAIPLLLGAGVDYTIHLQLALRRQRGDIRAVRRVTGRAVMLCAATTATGFGSNVFSSNAGLAALGGVCAAGIALTYLMAGYFLPAWWLCWHGDGAKVDGPATGQPSVIYHARLWRLGLTAGRLVPESIAVWLGRTATRLYCALHPRRRAVVETNLLPLCEGNPKLARQSCSRLYANFGAKLVQLLRREAGLFNNERLAHWSGWELLEAAQAQKRGVLLVTPHLGDWELGGSLLARRGVKLLVLTQPEPGVGFTELRQRSRALTGIETIVVGQDAFAFVEVIKHLQAGAVAALLVDRPPAPTAVSVDLFGRPFRASVAAAELARASGCVVLPVYVVQGEHGAEAHVLPEIDYDRQKLGQREARREMTQRLMRAFEPVIKTHAEQWYHFVPIWPEKGN